MTADENLLLRIVAMAIHSMLTTPSETRDRMEKLIIAIQPNNLDGTPKRPPTKLLCSHCNWWNGTDRDPNNLAIGECRRNAPLGANGEIVVIRKVIVDLLWIACQRDNIEPLNGKDYPAPDQESGAQRFPITYSDDWCGQAEPIAGGASAAGSSG